MILTKSELFTDMQGAVALCVRWAPWKELAGR